MTPILVKFDASNELSEGIGQELSKNDRPELTAAGTVISGGDIWLTSGYVRCIYCVCRERNEKWGKL